MNWDRWHINTLVRLYPDMRSDELAVYLGCTLNAVYAKASYLGLRKSEKFKASEDSGRALPGMKARMSA